MKHIFMLNRFSLKERLDKYRVVIEKVAKKLKLDYKIEINDDSNSTEDILKKYKKNKDIIYAVGGDGILNRVVNSMYGTKNKVASIPAGTGNDFYRTMNEYFTEGDNLVDVIRCNDKYFVNVACFGIDADIACDNTIVHNKLIPKPLQYKIGVAKHILFYKPYNFTMEWDKESRSTKLSLVTVCNASYYGGGFPINKDGKCDDGLLDVYIVYATNRRQLISYLISLLKEKHKESKYVEHVRTNKFTIIPENKIVGDMDGEDIEATRFEMSVIPKAMTFFYNKKLIEQINKELGK